MSEWISVNDHLPIESYERILAYGIPKCGTHREIPVIEFCLYEEGDFRFGEYSCFLETTHWMPLPSPPEEK